MEGRSITFSYNIISVQYNVLAEVSFQLFLQNISLAI